MNFELGQPVSFSFRAVKIRDDYKIERNNSVEYLVFYDRVPCGEQKGIITGIRYMRSGVFSESGYGEDYQRNFEIHKTVKLYLVTTNIYQNPVLVFPEDICKAE